MARLAVFLLGGIILLACQNSTDAGASKEVFTPLHLGDKTQIVFAADSSTTLIEILRKTRREDGTEVFEAEWTVGFPGERGRLSYEFIRDSFSITSELDSIPDETENPYIEQFLGHEDPAIGATWEQIPNNDFPGQVKVVAHEAFPHRLDYDAELIAFEYWTYPEDREAFITAIYGRGLGWMGSVVADTDTFFTTYKRIDGIEYGSLWPARAPSVSKREKVTFFRNRAYAIRLSGYYLQTDR
jgi:hypothetical protein